MEIEITSKITPSQKQQECIDALLGPVMVLAGPGTGKTFTVIQRLKDMLCKGILPEKILCLTFSETAAAEMKTRLMSEVGTVAASLKIGTYHAFCNEIISQYPMQFELFENVTTVDDITRFKLIKQIFEEYNPEHLRDANGSFYFYIKPVINAISEIKNTRTTKEKYFDILENSEEWGAKLKELLEEKAEKEAKGNTRTKTLTKSIEKQESSISKAKEVWDIFEIYKQKLKEQNYIDFNDMINFVIDEFENDREFLNKIASQYEYFLVDEYQDTNFSQNKLVFKLVEGSGQNNVFVVGDDDQIIFGFQGAQSDNLEKFLRHYPTTKVICLDENRRSTQNILDFSYSIMMQDSCRLENNIEFSQFEISKKLTAKNEKIIPLNKKINLYGFSDIVQENNFIVDEIEKIVSEGQEDLSQIAVLVNKNAEAKEMAELLKARRIPFQLKSKKSVFDVSSSILFIFYLKAILNPVLFADKLFGLLLSEPFSFHPEDYSFLIEQSRINHKDFIFNIRENEDYSWAEKDKVKEFLSVYDDIKSEIYDYNLKNFLILVLNKTGILEFFTKSKNNRIENISALNRVVQEAQNFMQTCKGVSLVDFIEHLDIAYAEELEVLIDQDETVKNAVQIMTLHGSKGREFEYVFMKDLRAKKWEKKRSLNKLKVPANKNSFDEESENLRLMFVGVTRAKHSLYLTYSNEVKGKPEELTKYLGQISTGNPFVFCKNYPLSQDTFMDEIVKSLTVLKYDYKKDLTAELVGIIKNISLSPSSLNLYIDCPRKFLYEQIYKIPSRDKDVKALNYGVAVHNALEKAVSIAIEKGCYPSCDEFIKFFVQKFNSMPLKNKIDRDVLLKKGEDALKEYYPHFANISTERLFATEFSLGKVPLDGIFITGKIDKIEKNKDGTFCLFDYKTGKSKTGAGKKVNELAHEKYLNQIRFYKLAFETLHKDAKVSQVGLIYVEDFEKNYIPEVCAEDNQNIKKKIFDVHSKIQNLEFEPICQKQNADVCKYCEHKMLCRLNVI